MGKIVIEPQFDAARSFDNGVAVVEKSQQEYAIYLIGNIVCKSPKAL